MPEPSETLDNRGANVVVPISRTIADYREAYSWQRWHSWSWPSLVIVALAVAGLTFLTRDLNTAITSVVLGLVALVAVYYASLLSVAARMQRAHLLNGEVVYTFTPEGFDYRSERSTSSTAWAAVNKGVETRRSYLLIYANTCFLVIPKACVPASGVARLRYLLATNLAGRVKLLPQGGRS